MAIGKFIVLEGGEGSGKGVCLRYLQEKLAERSDVVFTREPGGTEFGEAIRKIFLSKEMKGKISVLAELFTFCAIRANHCDLLVRPALQAGKIVICDRFDPSTIAYQIFGHEHHKYEKLFLEINALSKGRETSVEINPDLVIFLDVVVEEGLRRACARNEKSTRFDEEAVTFHQRVQEGYLSQLLQSENWTRIDANQPENAVKEIVWREIEKELTK